MTEPRPRGIPLGRVLGARVLLQPSTILMAVLLAVFYGTTDEGLTRRGFTLGLVVAIGLFVAVFLHEVAHTAVARAYGREVDRIVLTFFGGHTQFRSKDPRPLEIGLIAAAGPVANAAIGALSGAIVQTLDGMPALFLGYFAWMNLILAGFNALPGTPLDGGRVVTAIVWGATGDRYRGHRASAWGGRLIALGVLGAVILVPLSQGRDVDLVAVVWSMLLFAVIWPAASQELRAATVLSRREGMTAMTPGVSAVAVPFELSVAQARQIALREGAREVVVLSADGRPAGHFPVALTEAVPEDARATTALSSVTMPLVRGAEVSAALSGEELVKAVIPWIGRTDALAVMDGDVPVGIVMVEDLRQALG